MAEVKFYLEKRKDKATGDVNKGNVPILLFYSFNGRRLQYYTGYRIDAHKWDQELMKVKKNYSEAADINKGLNKLIAKVEEIHERADVLGEKLTQQYFKDRLNGKKFDARNSELVWKCYKEYLGQLKTTHAEKSIYNANSTFKVIQWFCDETRWSLTFDNTGQDFWQSFIDWCYFKKGYFNNYTGTHIDKFKRFLNWSVEKGYTTNLEFREQRKMQEFIDVIFLEFDEVLHFLNFEFEKESHRQVRDMYCLACFTGLRYSDVIRLLHENIQGDQIVYHIKKTKRPNVIPLNQYSRMILARNKKVHPINAMPQISDNNLNTFLKAAMKQAGFERLVQVIHFRGAERHEESLPLWDAANFHTSKKTFVTNFLQRGGQLFTAMAITGNRSLKTFRRYYKFTDQFKASEMSRIFGK